MTQTEIAAAVTGSSAARNALIAQLAATTDAAAIAQLVDAITYAAQQDVVRDIVVDLQDEHDEVADLIVENYLDVE